MYRRVSPNPESGYGRPDVRFWRKVDKDGPVHPVHGQCWVWTGSFFDGGYGQFRAGSKNLKAHRFSWTIHFGEILAGRIVLHKCDNPPCVNPTHLVLGSTLDNVTDMMSKGRDRVRGQDNGRAVLTADQVRQIRLKYRRHSSTDGSYALAKVYGVAQSTIMRIVRNRGWKNVDAGDLYVPAS